MPTAAFSEKHLEDPKIKINSVKYAYCATNNNWIAKIFINIRITISIKLKCQIEKTNFTWIFNINLKKGGRGYSSAQIFGAMRQLNNQTGPKVKTYTKPPPPHSCLF